MERGVALLHSFGYTIAQMQFEAIAKDDPACAMAHWGIAMTQFPELWQHPDEAQSKRGEAEMAKARALAAPPAKITPREQAYIDALSAFFDPAKTSFQQRADAYEAKMNALHAMFPDDVEGAAFDALSMLASVPPGDASLSHEHQALAILVPLFASHPDHPGLAHYIIHTCDTPALAPDGLAAAREYARIAPSSPHALHMPGHIFARLGMWQEDIDSNLASVKASEKAQAAGEPGAAHQMHADEFLIYAYLQVGEDEKARLLTSRMAAIGQQMASDAGHGRYEGRRPLLCQRAQRCLCGGDARLEGRRRAAAGSRLSAWPSFDTYWGQGHCCRPSARCEAGCHALAGLDRDGDALKKLAVRGIFCQQLRHQARRVSCLASSRRRPS